MMRPGVKIFVLTPRPSSGLCSTDTDTGTDTVRIRYGFYKWVRFDYGTFSSIRTFPDLKTSLFILIWRWFRLETGRGHSGVFSGMLIMSKFEGSKQLCHFVSWNWLSKYVSWVWTVRVLNFQENEYGTDFRRVLSVLHNPAGCPPHAGKVKMCSLNCATSMNESLNCLICLVCFIFIIVSVNY